MLQGGSGLSIPSLVSHCYDDPNCMTSTPSRPQFCPPQPQNGFHSGRTLQDIMYPNEMAFPGFIPPDPRGNQGLQPSWNAPPWSPRQNMPFLAHPHPGDSYQYGYGDMNDFSDDSSYAQKRKRARTAFSAEQLKKLEKRFQANHYIVGEERQKIAKDLELSEAQVKVWFQNRRTKYKRDQELERLGRKKKRKGEHHIRKWQITTRHFGPETNELFPDPDPDLDK